MKCKQNSSAEMLPNEPNVANVVIIDVRYPAYVGSTAIVSILTQHFQTGCSHKIKVKLKFCGHN